MSGKAWHLFFCSEAPGLVFSATYLRGKLAPSAVPGRMHEESSHEGRVTLRVHKAGFVK
jgi:hypothetical protein